MKKSLINQPTNPELEPGIELKIGEYKGLTRKLPGSGKIAEQIQEWFAEIYSPDEELLRVPRLYGLTVGERDAIKKAMGDERKIASQGAMIVIDIARKTGKSPEEIETAMNNPFAPESLELLGDNFEKIINLQESQDKLDYNQVLATTVFQSRVSPSWSIAHTNKFTEGFIERFMVFIQRETEGWEEVEGKEETDLDITKT